MRKLINIKILKLNLKKGHLKTSVIPIIIAELGYNQDRRRNILTRSLVALIYKR